MRAEKPFIDAEFEVITGPGGAPVRKVVISEWESSLLGPEYTVRYERLPLGHPAYDAEDLPHWWQRIAVEAVGGALLIVSLLAVMVLVQPLGPLLPRFLDWLTGAVFG